MLNNLFFDIRGNENAGKYVFQHIFRHKKSPAFTGLFNSNCKQLYSAILFIAAIVFSRLPKAEKRT